MANKEKERLCASICNREPATINLFHKGRVVKECLQGQWTTISANSQFHAKSVHQETPIMQPPPVLELEQQPELLMSFMDHSGILLTDK